MIRRPPRSTPSPTRRSSDLNADPLDPGIPAPADPWAAVVIPRLGLERRGSKVNRPGTAPRSEEHTSELQSQSNLVCRLLLEKKKTSRQTSHPQAYITAHGQS